MNATIDSFREAIAAAGLTPPQHVLADGKLHRFASNGRAGDDAGWYKLHDDEMPVGRFGCWRSGANEKWSTRSVTTMSATDRAAYQRRMEKSQRDQEAEKQRRHAEAAATAAEIWETAAPASDAHPYLQHKQVKAYGLRLDDEHCLLLPVRINGTISSLQFIDAAGKKLFLSGGAKHGGSFTIGTTTDNPVICIAEGYATAATIHEATGYPVVMAFDAGNLEPVARVVRAQYPDATIMLCVDNDIHTDGKPNTGVVSSTAAATAIGGLLAIPEMDGKKCDFNDVHVQRGLDAVREAIAAARAREERTSMTTATTERDRDAALGNEWPVLDAAARRGVIGDLVEAIEPHSEADPVALLVQALIAYGSMLNRAPYFQAEADRHYMNLNAALVGITSKGRKGVSWGHVKRACAAVDPTWASTRVLNGLSSGEGLIWAVRDEITKDEPVREKGRPTGDYQTVVVDRGITDKRLLVLESEFAGTLRVMGRDGNTLSAVIRQAWDSGDLRTMTKNSPAQATGAHISIIAHITKDELCRLIEATEASNGFCNRYLWLCVRRSKALPEGGDFDETAIAPIVQRLNHAVRFGRSAGEIKRDEGARAVWREVYPDLSEGKPGLLGSVISRAEAQVMRLACIYALQDMSYVVRPEHLTAALALWEYCESSARYIFGQRLGDPIADELLSALRSHATGMTRTEIRDWFGRNRKADEINRGLSLLAKQGLARREESQSGGRPIERWYAVSRGTT